MPRRWGNPYAGFPQTPSPTRDIGTGLHHCRMLADEPGTPPYEQFL